VPEARSKVVHRILEQTGEAGRSYTKERQLSAQSFTLHVERRDGKSAEGFSWSHYVGHHWSKDEGRETLIMLFGQRAVEVEGQNLGALLESLRDGQLNGIRELSGSQAALLRQANPDNEPIIESVRCYPEFEEILKEIKGENDDKGRFARRIER
jgi:hypothetical protein